MKCIKDITNLGEIVEIDYNRGIFKILTQELCINFL